MSVAKPMANSPAVPGPVPVPSGSLQPAGTKAAGVSREIASAYNQALRRASYLWASANARIRDAADTCPLCLVAAALGIGVAAGVALRIWRSSRYE